LGNREKASKFLRKAYELDPLTFRFRKRLAQLLRDSDDYDSALAILEESLHMDTERAGIYSEFGDHYMALEEHEKAIEYYEEATRRSYNSGIYGLIHALWMKGNQEKAIQLLDELIYEKDGISFLKIARIYALMEKNDNAIEWLTKAFDSQEFSVYSLGTIREFDHMRDDPRVEALEARIRYPEDN